jgi:hypothetical protein
VEDVVLRIRRNLVAVLVLAMGLTGILLATLGGTAGSAPAKPAVVVPAGGPAPGGMGYDSVGDGMGYDGATPNDGMGYDGKPPVPSP